MNAEITKIVSDSFVYEKFKISQFKKKKINCFMHIIFIRSFGQRQVFATISFQLKLKVNVGKL